MQGLMVVGFIVDEILRVGFKNDKDTRRVGFKNDKDTSARNI